MKQLFVFVLSFFVLPLNYFDIHKLERNLTTRKINTLKANMKIPLFSLTFLSLLAFTSCEELTLVSYNDFEQMKQEVKVGADASVSFTDQLFSHYF